MKYPRHWQRRRRQADFPIVPVLSHDVSFDALALACADRGLESLADFNAVSLAGDTPSQDELASIGRRCLASAFALRCSRGAANETVSLCLHTFTYAPPAERLHLDLDWSVPYAGPGPSMGDWAAELTPALRDVADVLACHSRASVIDAWVKARLPAALALGHAFPAKGATSLRLRHDGTVWLPDGPSGEAERMSVVTNRLGTGRTAILEVSISRDVTPAVSDWCRASGFLPGWRLRYAPAAGPSRASLHDDTQARDWARRIGDDVRGLWDRERIEQIHLFIAAPVAFTVMLGQQLCDKNHIYVYAHGADGSHLACIL
jgi:SMODS-associated and fused to various effectors sensor domain